MSKKFIPVLLILILAGLFVGYGVMGKGDKHSDDPKAKYQRILRNVGIVLEQGHYNPKKIDDKFSQEVLKKYEDALDPDKYIFLQQDIDLFKKYENKIDEEIHGAPIESFYTISDTYLKRIGEVAGPKARRRKPTRGKLSDPLHAAQNLTITSGLAKRPTL